ncbi:STAS domain-containing protein [Krasilnikovia sp. MM14-A1259]|uniref:STAS domain-containing protein n=1 Tax=Krasilnikovia sp. MM14-A1259 TaxID=3373539 RepID=UPI00382A92D9
MTSPFEVHTHDDGDGVARLAVRGEVDSDVSATLAAVIATAAGESGVTGLVIDLRHVSLLAAAGVRALLEGQVAAARHGCTFRVVNSQGIVHQVLGVVGVIDLLDVTSPPVQARR